MFMEYSFLPKKQLINQKRIDSSPDLIQKREDLILYYWNHNFSIVSQSVSGKRCKFALLGDHPFSTWKDIAIQQLQAYCTYFDYQ
jgi:hypothetical protein